MHSEDNLEDTKIFFELGGFMYNMFVNHEILYSNIPQIGKFEQNYHYFRNHDFFLVYCVLNDGKDLLFFRPKIELM